MRKIDFKRKPSVDSSGLSPLFLHLHAGPHSSGLEIFIQRQSSWSHLAFFASLLSSFLIFLLTALLDHALPSLWHSFVSKPQTSLSPAPHFPSTALESQDCPEFSSHTSAFASPRIHPTGLLSHPAFAAFSWKPTGASSLRAQEEPSPPPPPMGSASPTTDLFRLNSFFSFSLGRPPCPSAELSPFVPISFPLAHMK